MSLRNEQLTVALAKEAINRARPGAVSKVSTRAKTLKIAKEILGLDGNAEYIFKLIISKYPIELPEGKLVKNRPYVFDQKMAVAISRVDCPKIKSILAS